MLCFNLLFMQLVYYKTKKQQDNNGIYNIMKLDNNGLQKLSDKLKIKKNIQKNL